MDTVTLHQGSGTNVFTSTVTAAAGRLVLSRYRNGTSYASTPPNKSTWLPINITYLV